MAAPVRQHLNGFIAAARLRAQFLRDELAALRASVNRVENAQVQAGQVFVRGRMAHDRGMFERLVDLSYAPFGPVSQFPPISNVVAANRYSYPALAFVAGQVRPPADARLAGIDLFITRTVGVREARAVRSVAHTQLPLDVEITLEVRLLGPSETVIPVATDATTIAGTSLPASVQPNTYVADFKARQLSFWTGARLVAGPIRISTRYGQDADAQATPGVVANLPALIDEFAEGSLLAVILRAPRFGYTFLGNGNVETETPAIVSAPFLGEPYAATEGTSVGPAYLAMRFARLVQS